MKTELETVQKVKIYPMSHVKFSDNQLLTIW